MAAKTPLWTGTGGLDPNNGIWGGVNPVTTALATVGRCYGNKNGLVHTVWSFGGTLTDLDDTDTWTSGIQGIVAVAWQADQADNDIIALSLTDAATGRITASSAVSNGTGWVHVFSRAT